MLSGILSRVMGGRRRSSGMRGPTAGPTTGRPAAGGSSRDIERGAKSILRGFSKRRRGL